MLGGMDDYTDHTNLPTLSVTSASSNRDTNHHGSDDDNAVGEMSDSSSSSSSSDSDSDPEKTVVNRTVLPNIRNSTNGYHGAASKVTMQPTNNVFDDLQLSEESD